MSRPQLRIAAVVLTVLMVVVGANALDRLPGSLRTQIDAERTALAAAKTQLSGLRIGVASQVQAEPDFFGALPFGHQWPDRFSQAENELATASHEVDQLTSLEKHNRHSDKAAAESLLAQEKKARTKALSDGASVQLDATNFIDERNNLPRHIPEMERNYQAIHAFDFAPVTAAVQRAETDWPEKKSDLEARLAAEQAVATQTDAQWQATAGARAQAAAGKLAPADAGVLVRFEDSLQSSAAALPKQADELKSLSAQLYTSWDKLLVDMQTRGDGNAREYDQKIRTVRTQLANAAAKTGDVTSDEQWAIVPKTTYDAMRNDLGMAIEHKPAGKFDAEADRVAQPAGMAYVAPPSQASNQYGYWDHRDGRDFWVFYGQYALLRDLLSNHDYRPFDRYEYEDYRNYQTRGQTYYGRESSGSAPKYGTEAPATQNRYSSSNYAHTGGFRDSKYAAKSGSYRDSQFASPSAHDPNADHSPKTFGHNAAPAAPPARTYHPAPAPSRTPSRSPARSFGKHH